VTGEELADRGRAEWELVERVMAVHLGEGWPRRLLEGKCRVEVDRKTKLITFVWEDADIDLTLIGDGGVVVCGWQKQREVVVTVFNSDGEQVGRRVEPVRERAA
jgi:hypothetical protein